MQYTWLGVDIYMPSLSLYLYLSGSQWWNPLPGRSALEQQAPTLDAYLTALGRSDIKDRTCTVTITSSPLALTIQTYCKGGRFCRSVRSLRPRRSALLGLAGVVAARLERPPRRCGGCDVYLHPSI